MQILYWAYLALSVAMGVYFVYVTADQVNLSIFFKLGNLFKIFVIFPLFMWLGLVIMIVFWTMISSVKLLEYIDSMVNPK